MRKFISLILFATMLVSCGSDYDLKGNHEEPEAKLYEIAFAIESKSFEVEVEPLSSASYGATERDYSLVSICQIIIYNKVGAVVYNNLYTAHEVSLETVNGVFCPKISLPKGEYQIAVLSRLDGGNLAALVIMDLGNFETDYFGGYRSAINPVHYALVPYTVSEGHNDVASIVLQPMYSLLTFKIKDHKTFSIPEDAEEILVYASKSAGFYVKTMLPRPSTEMEHVARQKIEDLRKVGEFKLIHFISAIEGNSSIEFRFIKTNKETNVEEVIDTRTIANFKLENGKSYTISGNLGDAYYPSDAAFGITWGSIGGEGIEIPFDE